MNHGAAGSPEPSAGGGAGFYEARSDDFSRFKEEFRAVQLGTVIPLAAWLNDQPWNLIWVRWFLFYALFPIAVGFFFGREGVALGDAAWAFGLYFAGVWLTVLNLTLRPETIRYGLLAQIWFFTVIVGITLVLVGQQLPGISSLYASTHSAILLPSWLGFVFGVGLLEEAVKALPVYLFGYQKREHRAPLTYAYLGAVSGLAFGVAEAVSYSFLYARGLQAGAIDLGGYIVVQFARLITLPLLHAMFSGIAGYFIGLATLYPRAPRALMVIGLSLAALLHGTYDQFAESWLGIGVAVLTLLVFISYVRTSDLISRALVGEETTSWPMGSA